MMRPGYTRSIVMRLVTIALAVLGLGLVPAGAAFQDQEADPASEAGPVPIVYVAEIDSPIHPVVAEFVEESLEEADREGAEAIVFQLSTPGGLMTSTREITTAILGARTPVVVWVAPSGAQAASAGFFILQSADVAAMAPGTNTGAAHPVGGQGEEIEGTMGEKVEQDAAAQIRSLAARHERNVDLAQAAVIESRSFTADEALEENLIDLVAPSITALLVAIDGTGVAKGEGDAAVLRTTEADLRRLEMTAVQRFLSVLADPNVAYILLSLGFLGLYFEFANPGAIFPGVMGAICLLLGFYALSVLPLNYAGVALILLAVVLFIAEVKVTSYGLLTVGGVISLVIGSLMLFKSAGPAFELSVWVVASVASAVFVATLFLMTLVVNTHRSRITTGSEGIVGELGVARGILRPYGKVFVHGEIWHATAEQPVAAGETVEVVGVDGMRLVVRPQGPYSEQSPAEVPPESSERAESLGSSDPEASV